MWTADNPTGNWPGLAPNAYNGNNPAGNDFYLQSANFIRLKNITLGYTLPSSIIGTKVLRSARLFFDVQNLLTITDFKGLDPEILETNPYPLTISTTIGVNLGF